MERYYVNDKQAFKLNDAGVPYGNPIVVWNYMPEMNDRVFNETQVRVHQSQMYMTVNYFEQPLTPQLDKNI